MKIIINIIKTCRIHFVEIFSESYTKDEKRILIMHNNFAM